jgi:hypothetical protein
MVLDDGLIRMTNALAMTDNAARLPENLDARPGSASISVALKAAASIYRARLRPARASATTMLGSHPRSLS